MVYKYCKEHYQSKINELESYLSMVDEHIETMEQYQEELYQFWDSERVREKGEALKRVIKNMKDSQERVRDLVMFNQTIVANMPTSWPNLTLALVEDDESIF